MKAPSDPAVKRLPIEQFVWVDDLSTYARCLAASACGVAPVLRPSDPLRRVRWLDVLRWYGLRETRELPEGVAPLAGERVLRSDDDCVAALGPSVRELSGAYAAATGRVLAVVREPGDIHELVTVSRPNSVLIIADAYSFSFEALSFLQEALDRPWSVLCARDVHALSFAVAKQLVGRDRVVGQGRGGLDVLRGRCMRLDPRSGEFSFGALRERTAVEWTLNEEWHNLALVAHGEGAHLNLGSVVCCGTMADEKPSVAGHGVRVCTQHDGVRTCKRASSAVAHVMRFGDLRAQAVALLSCIGMSTSREVYASDHSLVLDAVEGYPASVVTTDRIVPVPPALPAVWLGLYEEGLTTAEIVALFNEVNERHHGGRAYLVFGDAFLGPREDRAQSASPMERAAYMRVLATDSDRYEVYRSLGGRALLLPGRRSVVVSSRSEAAALPPLATREFQELRRALEYRALAACGAASLEASLGLAARLAPDGRDREAADLRELATCRARVEGALVHALHYWEAARVSGVWTQEVDRSFRSVAEATGEWDRAMITLVDRHLLGTAIEEAVGIGRACLGVENGGRCSRCRSRLRVERRGAVIPGAPVQHRIDCPLCGGRETFLEGSCRLVATEAAGLVPGTVQSVDIDVVGPGLDSGPLACDGWLAMRLTDRGSGRVLFRATREIQRSLRLEVVVPADTTMELHIQKYVLVRGMRLSYLRHRIPAMPTSIEQAGRANG